MFFVSSIYWICIIIGSLIGMSLILTYTVDMYENNAITINMDTAYLKWNNTFPAVSFCMLKTMDIYGINKVKKFITKYYDDHKIDNPFG